MKDTLLTKEDWLDVFNTLGTRDWLDWMNLVVSIISPLLVVASVYFAGKAAKAAKAATDLNVKMYNDQKDEKSRMRKSAFQTELSKLNQSLYLIQPYFHPYEKKSEIQKRQLALDLKPILELIFNKLDRIDVSVFSHENQSHINYVHSNIGFRIAELNKIKCLEDPELDRIYMQLFGVNAIIQDNLSYSDIKENELIK